MPELIIEKVDGTTIRRRYETWESFDKLKLLKLKEIDEKALEEINLLLLEFDK